MKQRQFVFAIMAMLLCFVSPAFAQNVAKIGETEYTTLSAAIGAASSGGKVTLIDNVSENVTISKNLTVDGAGKQYTGTMTINTGLTVTVEKVNFYNAGIVKASGSKGTITVKDCTFDGAGRTYGYAVKTSGAGKLTIENCTVKDYNFGFLYNSKSLTTHSVKNVTVENCNYGVRMASCNTTNLVNFVTKDVKWPVQIQANAARTVNMTDCSITGVKEGGKSLSCWDGTSTVTFNFKGTNVFDAALPEDANFVYNEDAADEVDNVIIVKPAVAKVGEQGYETLAAAVVAASANQTITLLKDIEEDVTLTKSVTINGASYKYTGTMSANTGITVTVKNVNFVNGGFAKDSKTVSGTYSFIDCTFDGKGTYYYPLSFRAAYAVKVENCTVKDYKYSFLYVRGSVSSYLNVKNVTVENCPEYAVYFASGVANAMIEGLTVENSNIGFRINNTANRSLTIKDCTMVDVETAVNYNGGTKTITCTLQGVNEFGDAVFSQYVNVKGVKVGTKYVATLAEALDIAENGATVTLISDIKLTQGIANSKTITLDLNGKTLSMEDASSATAALITNTGNLTITDSSEAKEGKISFKTTTASANNSYASNTISNRGTITIEAGTIENLSTGGGACYALDNYAGSTATINGGKLVAEKTTVRIFNWTDGEAAKATLNVNGGEIVSNVGYGINVNSGNTPYVALNISGGVITTNDTAYNLAVYVVNKDGAQNFTANVTGGTFNGNFALNGVTSTTMAQDAVSITGGAFAGIICYEEPAYAFVKGGTYTMDVTAYCPEGYVCIENTDGTYTVKYDPAYGNVAKIGTAYYATLTEAVAAAQDGETVVVIDNIALDATVVVDNKTMTLDLNGMTITGTDNNTSGNFYLINNNKGNLTIVDGAGSGKITLVATTERNWSASSVVVANNLGTVTVKGGTIEHLGGTSMAYGIDNLTNGANTVATLNIEGGSVASTYFAVRQFANNGTNNLNITGGNVGYAWMQSPNNNANVANISVTGGEVAGICFSGVNANVTLNAKVECVGEVYGKMPAGVVLTTVNGYYTFAPAVAAVGDVLYASIQAAVDAAQDGETVTLISDITLTNENAKRLSDVNGAEVMVTVSGNVILDMNGKKITVSEYVNTTGGKNPYLLGVFYIVDGAGLTVTGNGTIDIPQTDTQVGYVFWKRGTEGHLVIKNGTFHAGNLEDSMVYTNGSDIVTVEGGTFTLDGVGSHGNGFPVIFNASGNNVRHINVTGGTYNTDITKQRWSQEVKLGEGCAIKDNGDDTWSVIKVGAYVAESADGNKVPYTSLAAAVAAAQDGNIVTLAADAEGEGIVINKSITIDFDENTYTVNEGVGSTGTPSNGFQILKDNTVVLKNGTLNVAEEAADKFYILVQNYANLTVKDMTLDGKYLDKWSKTDGDSYVLSNNSGNVVVEGETNIIANNDGDKAFAFDACDKTSWGYTLPAVKVYTTGEIVGKIENSATNKLIDLYAGTYSFDVIDFCASRHATVDNYNDTWTVEALDVDSLVINHIEYYTYENQNEKSVKKLVYNRDIYQQELGAWTTLFVPFDVPVKALLDKGLDVAYINNVRSYDKNDDALVDSMYVEYVLIKTEKARLHANTPYMIRADKQEELSLSLVLENATLCKTDESVRNNIYMASAFVDFTLAGVYEDPTGADIKAKHNADAVYQAWNGWQDNYGNYTGMQFYPFEAYLTLKTKPGSPFGIDFDALKSIGGRVVGEEYDGTTYIYDVVVENGEEVIYDLQGRRVNAVEKGIYIKGGNKVLVR